MKTSIVCLIFFALSLLPASALAQKTAEDYLKASQDYLQKRDLDRALKSADKAIEMKPDFAQAYNYRSSLKLMKGDVAAALKDLDQALLIDTDLTEAYVVRGQLRMITGEIKGALNDFDNAIARGHKTDEIYSRRASLKTLLQDWQGALQDYNTAISMNPDRIGYHVGRAVTRERLGDDDGALADYTYVIEADQGRRKSGNYPKSRTTADLSSPVIKGVERPSSSNTNEKIRTDTVVTMNPEAEATMTPEEMEYQPNLAGAYLNRAQILSKRGDADGAMGDLNKSIEIFPLYPAYSARARELEKRRDLRGALADFTKSIELQPESAFTYVDRGAILLLLNRDEDAEKDFRRALDLSPDLAPTVENRRAEAKKQRAKPGFN